jgi:hypothetical protein
LELATGRNRPKADLKCSSTSDALITAVER